MGKSCPVCLSPLRYDVDAALRSERYKSPRMISRLFRFSRADIKRHRTTCLGRNPLTAHLMLRGALSEEDLAALLVSERGLTEEEAKEAASVFARQVGAS